MIRLKFVLQCLFNSTVHIGAGILDLSMASTDNKSV